MKKLNNNEAELKKSVGYKETRVYQFITSNHASFHLWWKEKLLNHQKISKYYEADCGYLFWTERLEEIFL